VQTALNGRIEEMGLVLIGAFFGWLTLIYWVSNDLMEDVPGKGIVIFVMLVATPFAVGITGGAAMWLLG
jgi:hypothetical protein